MLSYKFGLEVAYDTHWIQMFVRFWFVRNCFWEKMELWVSLELVSREFCMQSWKFFFKFSPCSEIMLNFVDLLFSLIFIWQENHLAPWVLYVNLPIARIWQNCTFLNYIFATKLSQICCMALRQFGPKTNSDWKPDWDQRQIRTQFWNSAQIISLINLYT